MTCIIGHRDGWMVADKRTTWGGHVRGLVVEKILKGPGLLVAIAGDSAAKTLTKKLIASKTPVDSRLSKVRSALTGLDWEGIFVAKGRVGFMCKEGGIYEASGDYLACGAGEHFVLGFMAASKRVSLDSAVVAIRACSEQFTGVSYETTSARL